MHSNAEPKLFEIALLFMFYFLLIEFGSWLLCILGSNTLLLAPHIVKERMHRKMQESISPHIYEQCSPVVIYCERIIWELDGTIFDPTF
jgi:hypothetical protein